MLGVGVEPTPFGFSDRRYRPHKLSKQVKQVTGFEPVISPWQGEVLPLYYTCIIRLLRQSPEGWTSLNSTESTIRDSNPPQMLGRHRCYHYTNGARTRHYKRLIISQLRKPFRQNSFEFVGFEPTFFLKKICCVCLE